jgi:hypothetical protein
MRRLERESDMAKKSEVSSRLTTFMRRRCKGPESDVDASLELALDADELNATDRTFAIMNATRLEHEIERAILTHCVPLDDNQISFSTRTAHSIFQTKRSLPTPWASSVLKRNTMSTPYGILEMPSLIRGKTWDLVRRKFLTHAPPSLLDIILVLSRPQMLRCTISSRSAP